MSYSHDKASAQRISDTYSDASSLESLHKPVDQPKQGRWSSWWSASGRRRFLKYFLLGLVIGGITGTVVTVILYLT